MTTEKVPEGENFIGDGNTLNDSEEQHPLAYKISYPPALETQIRKMRESLESWKEIIIPIYSVLIWEKQWQPAAIVCGTTVAFMLLWISETSLLTFISLAGLFLTLCDYLIPSIVSSLFKTEQWTPAKENIIEGICSDIILYKTKLEVTCVTYYRMRVTNPKMYFGVTVFALAFLAWIGGTFNNLFLMYLFTTVLLLIPGIERNGVNTKFKDTIVKFISDLISSKTKKEQ